MESKQAATRAGAASSNAAVSRQPAAGSRTVSLTELRRHATREDCWTSIHGKVYNVTTFLDEHPGGAKVILKYAGQDSSRGFDMAGHSRDIVTQLGLDHLLVGDADDSIKPEDSGENDAHKIQQFQWLPPIDTMLSLFDIEAVARTVMNPTAWNYYSSGADDEITMRENHAAFQRIWFRPRVLVNVKEIDLRTTIMGYPSALPIYITSCALGRLAHPDGECVLTRAAHSAGVIQMCPTLASCTLDEMLSAAKAPQVLFYQLYVNHDRKITAGLIQKAKAGGVKAVAITVDAPQLGRREKDMRGKFDLAGSNVQRPDDTAGKIDRSQGAARTISAFIDPSLSWDDIEWLKKECYPMKVLLKGVQTAEDAIMAVEFGLDGIICSNHGGRQMDFARSGIEVLAEVMSALKARGMHGKLEVLVDGGIRRGSDVMKALALGASAVGIGRPTLYGMASYGQAGVEKVLKILADEMEMGMKLVGAPSIKDITPGMITVRNLGDHITPVPADELSAYTYEKLQTTSKL
eukprot:m.460580 g.460580  ORF g.460580 m.460580 type:complete len:520 (-) comp22071_c0_seq1:63-1622(-)